MRTRKAEILGGPNDGIVVEIPENLRWNGGLIEIFGCIHLVSNIIGERIKLIHSC